MVIQRWQSVFLLVGAIAMGVFTFKDIACIDAGDGSVVCWNSCDCMPVFVLNILVVLMAFINIFLYNNLGVQKNVTAVTTLLAVLSLVLTVWAVVSTATVVSWCWTIAMPIVAIIFFVWARRRMVADERLLKSYDRLR